LRAKKIHFNLGAGIVADSDPEAEYEGTPAKAAGFLRRSKIVGADVRRLISKSETCD
jgi:anthranilate/para-aminobenzoate synthase component I